MTRLKELLNRMLGKRPQPEYEPEMTAAVRRFVRPGWVCADVGAHTGHFSRIMAELAGPTGLVVAFEPLPANVATIQRQARRWKHGDRIRVENCAIADGSASTLPFYHGRGDSNWEWNLLGHDVEGNRTEARLQVPARSLDQYFPPGSRLDFVKMDIEGAEVLALPGMRRLLREARPTVIIEFHGEAGWAARKEFFEQGYRLCTMDGRVYDPSRDTHRLYHGLVQPTEAPL